MPGRLEQLADKLPDTVPRVAESGVATVGDAARLAGIGYQLALIGSALDDRGRSRSPAEEAAAGRPSERGRMSGFVKICGLTDESAVRTAIDAGADAIGFVFAKSSRQVTPQRADELARPARGRALCIAVTLHPAQRDVDAILADFAPDALQTDAEDFAELTLPARARAVAGAAQ